MHEFGTPELLKFACPVCGSKNKKYIPIMYKNTRYGYALHCCNCGNVTEFIAPYRPIGGLYNGQLMAGGERDQRCLASTGCERRDCPLHRGYVNNLMNEYHDQCERRDDTFDHLSPNPDHIFKEPVGRVEFEDGGEYMVDFERPSANQPLPPARPMRDPRPQRPCDCPPPRDPGPVPPPRRVINKRAAVPQLDEYPKGFHHANKASNPHIMTAYQDKRDPYVYPTNKPGVFDNLTPPHHPDPVPPKPSHRDDVMYYGVYGNADNNIISRELEIKVGDLDYR